ncbi:MAG: ComF family protein [Pseudomonadota bacterium]
MLSGMLLKTLRRAAGFAADALYPPRCPLCDAFVAARDEPCEDCSASLNILEADACLLHLSRSWFLRCRSRFAYDGPIRNALQGFKYGERLDLLRFLTAALAEEARRMGGLNLVVPVPLHPKRLGNRGFNQSALLATRLGKISGAQVELGALLRTRDIAPQVGLERAERMENVKGAFAVDEKRTAKIALRDILLIDDVLTTGATVNECARALMKSGANSVSVLTVARTL